MKKITLILMLSSLLAHSSHDKDEVRIIKNSKVEIYTALFWAPCKEAKLLLQSRGIDFDTKMVTFSRNSFEEMLSRSGGKTSVPQIFVDGEYFGGLKELISYYKEN